VHVCGNCGAPLDLNDDGECRWCQAKVRVRRQRSPEDGPWGWPAAIRWRWNWRFAAVAAAAVALAAGLGIGLSAAVSSYQSGPPAATASGSSGAGQGVPPQSTDLQAVRADFGPWHQVIGHATDIPALMLLEGGAAYASEPWTVPATATGWAPDLGGNVATVTVTAGDYADITDPDGVSYTVAVDQAFIIAGNPGTVLLISPDGTVMSMSLAQATAVRQSNARF
jgi:hypothetical protein